VKEKLEKFPKKPLDKRTKQEHKWSITPLLCVVFPCLTWSPFAELGFCLGSGVRGFLFFDVLKGYDYADASSY